MELEKFLTDLQELLQRDEPVAEDDVLENIEEWDSMAMMACMVYFDANFGLSCTISAFQPLKTVRDIINLAQGRIQ